MHTPLRTIALIAISTGGLGAALSAADDPDGITSLQPPYPTVGSIERLDPAIDALLPADAAMEKLAEGFRWAEGPVWMPSENALIFSDVPANIAYRWREGSGIDVFLSPSGLTAGEYDGKEPGSNGLTLDAEGRLLLAQHGNRCIARLNDDGHTFTTLADHWDGRRFNSPNDLCVDRHGNIYFTDPPYGLGPGSKREIEWQGVYRISPDGKVTLISQELERPNGLALSPDERTLYVANSHPPRPIIMAYTLDDEGLASGPGRVFFDATGLVSNQRQGLMDGMKVDVRGNLWATGPGGILVIDSSGRHLGTLLTGQPTANCGFGGPDAATLYITSNHSLLRIRTTTQGRTL